MVVKEKSKVLTACGAVEPVELGAVMMHEHLHLDYAQKNENSFDPHKWDVLEREALPMLKKLKNHGCHTIVDMTFPPHRATPWVYKKISEMADFHLVLTTGFYREVELGTYWAHLPADQIWPFVKESSLEELEEFCLREYELGIHESGIRPGVLKIATSSKEFTKTEKKAAIAVSRVQKQTGLLINTHAGGTGTYKAQLDLIESEGVDPKRVCLGHTERALISEWEMVKECMKRGASFALTSLRNNDDWLPRLADAIKRAFDEGYGEQLTLSMDSGFAVGYAELRADKNWRYRQGNSNNLIWDSPVSSFSYLFSNSVPVLLKYGVTEEMLNKMLVENPQKILPIL